MNKLLLDTHALVDFARREVSSQEFMTFLEDARIDGRLFVSSVSFWELGLLIQKKRIELRNVGRWSEQVLDSSGIRLLSPSISEMIASTELPLHHKDPFDRVLVAQAKARGLVIVSRDELLRQYAVKVIWRS